MIAALLLGSAILGADAPSAGFTVMGAGATYCGLWTDNRHNDQTSAWNGEAEWVVGYVSGVNAADHGRGDILGDVGSDLVVTWLDKFCAANPGATLGVAAQALVEDLRARRRQ